MANTQRRSPKIVTAAIDFGTTFSGYAYGFLEDLRRDPPVIITNSWGGGNRISSKAPTSVLFRPDKTLASFGYEAEREYAELCDDGVQSEWFYFRRFKMKLHSTGDLTRRTDIEDEGGKHMPAMTVFATAIRYMKQHLLTVLRNRISSVEDDDIGWVLTVPAIWEEAAKQFMREAAREAGITSENLVIALEPEVAAIYTQNIATEKTTFPGGAALRISEPGSTFMVLDIGGGTADITVAERGGTGGLKLLHQASGGAWGGTKVDECFKDFLVEIFGGSPVGKDILADFKMNSAEDFMDMFNEFELVKRDKRLVEQSKLSVRLPVSLVEIVERRNGLEISQVIGKSKYSSSVNRFKDKLRIDSVVVAQMFKLSINSIISHLKTLFLNYAVSEVSTIVMVGGFSDSLLLQKEIRSAFPNKKVFIPGEPDISVLKGAVLFGNDPESVTHRVSRFTYGIEINRRLFGNVVIPKSFYAFVQSGQTLKVGDSFKASFNPDTDDATEDEVKIFASVKKEPQYTTEEGCDLLGSFKVLMPDTTGGKGRIVEIEMSFAGTEIKVEALDKNTMKRFEGQVNFLQ